MYNNKYLDLLASINFNVHETLSVMLADRDKHTDKEILNAVIGCFNNGMFECIKHSVGDKHHEH